MFTHSLILLSPVSSVVQSPSKPVFIIFVRTKFVNLYQLKMHKKTIKTNSGRIEKNFDKKEIEKRVLDETLGY